MSLVIHGLEAVLPQVVADGRRVAANTLADLFEGEALRQVAL
jgi:hypothetical protein